MYKNILKFPLRGGRGCRAAMRPAKWPPEPPDKQNDHQAPRNRLRAPRYVSKPPPFYLKKMIRFYIHQKPFFSNNLNKMVILHIRRLWRILREAQAGFALGPSWGCL